jgi:putative NADH-flavin reductase
MAQHDRQSDANRCADTWGRAKKFWGDREMRLFIVGATGGIGAQLVEQALARGHRVTAFVRVPEKVGRTHERLTIVGGDPLDAEQLRQALPDNDVVLSAIGPSPRPRPSFAVSRIFRKNLSTGNGHTGNGLNGRTAHTVHRDLAHSLVPAMESAAVRRLVAVSSAFLFSDALVPAVFGRLFFHDTVKDAAEMESTIVASRLQWTIVRPPELTDGSRTEHYRVKDGHLPGFGFRVSRADVAHFMLDEVEASRHLRKVVGVCY